MGLTAQDVHDKQFKLVRGSTGYDMDEVDAFLDEIESEVRRLTEQVSDQQAELKSAESAAPTSAPAVATPEQNALAAAKILELAQRTADEHVAQADRTAEQILADARAEAQVVVAALEARQAELEGSVAQLTAFETDLRTRLRGYLETLLAQLNDSEPARWDELAQAEPIPTQDRDESSFDVERFAEEQVPEPA